MIGRYTAAILGLLAFSVSAVVGVVIQNPAEVTLSRAIWALFVFCLIGLVVGGAAQYVINDYAKRRLAESLPELRETSPSGDSRGPANSSTDTAGEPMEP
jgi:membrane protein YqaA with SNARE-associated domain